MYNRIAMNYFYADKNFDKSGDKTGFPANGRFRDVNLSYYLEYGLSGRSTLTGSLAYKDIKWEDDSERTYSKGIGDMDLGLRFKIGEGDAGVLSTQWMIKIPETYDKDAKLPLGNGQYDIEGRMLYGKSLWRYLPGYLNIEAAYRHRFEDFNDEFRYLAEFGVNFSEKFYGRTKLDGIKGINNHKDTTGNQANPTVKNDFDLGRLDITIGYHLKPDWWQNSWPISWIEAQYVPSIYGKNTADGANYALAFIFKM